MSIRDPISTITHFIGAVLSGVAIFFLLYKGAILNSVIHTTTYLIFGISLFLLYCASTVYHAIDKSEKIIKIFKKIDHMMIFVLIAGTYTPVCILALNGQIGYIMFGVIWGVAIFGIFLKAKFNNIPRWISSGLYILMGWLCIFAIYPLFTKLPLNGFIWLVAGGVIYTIGGIIYATKWPKINNKWFGFHEIFHLFVMGGSVCHFVLIYIYI